MKKIKNMMSLALTMIMLVTLLTACGQEKNKSDAPADEPAGSVAPAADGSGAEGTVTFVSNLRRKLRLSHLLRHLRRSIPIST